MVHNRSINKRIDRINLSNLSRCSRFETSIETRRSEYSQVSCLGVFRLIKKCRFSRQFLRREQYPFIEAQSAVSSKTYHWINQNRSTSTPGSPWYLIAMDWWNRWEALPTQNESLPSPIMKKSSTSKLNKTNNGVDFR